MIVDPKAIIESGLAHLPAKMDSRSARVMLYATGRQESRFEHRRQLNKGPAMGFWQFERGGGVTGVLRHETSRSLARQVCRTLGVDPVPSIVWFALERNDDLAAALARLLLWTDPAPLPEPAPENEQLAWDYYVRNWRPGKPHRETWGEFWREACAAYELETA